MKLFWVQLFVGGLANLRAGRTDLFAISFIAVLLNCGTSTAQQVPVQVLAKVKFNDPNWGFPAYFTIASKIDAAAMKKYVASYCRMLEPVKDAPFCHRADYFFYTGIDGWGKRSKSGYICEKKLGLAGQRYFGDSRFVDYRCVFLLWDSDKARYEIQPLEDEEP